MRHRLLFSGLVAVGLTLGVAVQPAQASEELNSSMIATCVGVGFSCDLVEFALHIESPSAFVSTFTLFGSAGLWEFGTFEGASSGNWFGFIAPTMLSATTPNPLADNHFTFRVQMTTWGNWQDFPAMTYTANGYPIAEPTSPEGYFSAGGTVTPEPITTLLLGTGLAGIAGVARRRRSRIEEEEDTA